jgi:adenylate cyclase
MQSLAALTGALVGDPRQYPLERRLFHAVSLLNAVTNFGGLPGLLLFDGVGVLFGLNLGIGLIFLGFYLAARLGGLFRGLYWPFVLTIWVFLFANMLFNAGTKGGAVWYLVPAVIIATALSGRPLDAAISAALFGGAAVAVLVIEQHWPALIRTYATPRDRLADVAGNLLFAILFSGGLVLLLIRTLNAERHRSEALLLNVLPREIADELRREGRVVPRHYDSATVLFTDFSGFTRIAESMNPSEVIARLDEVFQEFDRIVESHGLEKIKTIGDAYLAVGGVPCPSATHATDCARAALEMRACADRIRQRHVSEGREAWGIRIGLHSGPLAAGVVGIGKFAYDVWGDTVNTASRIESCGVAGEINLSADAHRLIADRFLCEPRGRVSAKGKGELDLYLLKDVREQPIELPQLRHL